MSNQFGAKLQKTKDARDALLGGLNKSESGGEKQADPPINPLVTTPTELKTEPISEPSGKTQQASPQTTPSESQQNVIATVLPPTGSNNALIQQSRLETHTESQNDNPDDQKQAGGEKASMISSQNHDHPYDPNQFDPIIEPVPYKPRRYKKERLVDTHTQKSYYIENEIAKIIEELSGGDTGFKYRFINEAVRLLIHQEYPEHIYRLRKQK